MGSTFKIENYIFHLGIGSGKITLIQQLININYLIMIFIILNGARFYRDCRFAKQLSKEGEPIICTYHGQDMRTRGVIKEMDEISDLILLVS